MNFGTKSFLLDDDTADTLMEYAALITASGDAETVILNALGSDGDNIEVQLLLSAGAPLVAETASAELPVPDNTDVVEHMKAAIARSREPHMIRPETADSGTYNDLDLS